MFCLQFARLVMLLGAVALIVAGVVSFVEQEVLAGLLILLVGVPVDIGIWVALGLAIHYADDQA